MVVCGTARARWYACLGFVSGGRFLGYGLSPWPDYSLNTDWRRQVNTDDLKDNVKAFEVTGEEAGLIELVTLISSLATAERMRAAEYRRYRVSNFVAAGTLFLAAAAVLVTVLVGGGA